MSQLNSGTSNSSIRKDTITNSNVFDTITFPLMTYTLGVEFYLSSDILKAVLFTKKSNSNFVIHSYTLTNTNYAFVKDHIYFLDYYLRTNYNHILNTNYKKIKFPIVTNGSLYIPHLLFIRTGIEKNYNYLEYPVRAPVVFSQLFNESFFEQNIDKVNKFNKEIIRENIENADTLNYDTIIVQLTCFHNDETIYQIINTYVEMLSLGSYTVLNNLVFVIDMAYDGFINFYYIHGLSNLVEKNNIKIKIFSEEI